MDMTLGEGHQPAGEKQVHKDFYNNFGDDVRTAYVGGRGGEGEEEGGGEGVGKGGGFRGRGRKLGRFVALLIELQVRHASHM